MTKSCVTIWVSKMRSDYGTYLTQAEKRMKQESIDLSNIISSKFLYVYDRQ